jgi:hypothetical protein
MKDLKKDFLKEEVWVLAYGGAFQRANVYKAGARDLDKKHFKIKLRGYIEAVLIYKLQSSDRLKDQEHLLLIRKIVTYSEHFKEILKNGSLNLGVSQKLVNLIFKYYWCLGLVKEPPHFPVDSIIQKHIPFNLRVTWTQMTKDEEYLQVINAVRDQVLGNDETLAQWELKSFNRR